ncbi:T9SS C-terminal target domain-containing protein [Flavobacterium polysaccharolyticum]|uniref:T9SS C-terminal target domain-containing protein n=1 Tax=Flavobacterium polysaccharolyticum TaxID=3133148 RepID=A0ABU9NN95_9FLAO
MKFLFYLICCFSIAYPQTNKGINAAVVKKKNCECPKNKIKPLLSTPMSDSIKETSGLVFFEGLFWTHNDDHDTTLYGLDNSGKIKRKIKLNGVVNHDWEEITQDSSYLYIGDFGNNYSGNRKDLSILKIEKTSFLQEQPHIETITFSYSNQTDFSPLKPNKTAFDCEAFIVTKDSIYLFTKEWETTTTSLYALPNKTDHQVAQLQASWDCKGLITGATYLNAEKKIVLCGYTKRGSPFLYLLYDFEGNHFFSGSKKRINLKLRFHQIEGIATTDGNSFYLTNEAFVRKPFLKIPQQWHIVELKDQKKKN